MVLVVAYSAEVEKPWLETKKDDRSRVNPALSFRNKSQSSSRATALPRDFKAHADSFDSSSSQSSQSDRIPDFDPDTYVVKRKSSSISSQGARSDSTDSSHSMTSHVSGHDPRSDRDSHRLESRPTQESTRYAEDQFGSSNKMASPRKMVINVNGRSRKSESAERKHSEQSPMDKDAENDVREPSLKSSEENGCSDGKHCDSSRERLPSKMKITISTKGVPVKNKKVEFEDENGHEDVFEATHAEINNNVNKNIDDADDAFDTINERYGQSKGLDNEPLRMPTPLKNLQEMMDMFEVDAFENEVKRRGSVPLGSLEPTGSSERVAEEDCQQVKMEKEPESERDFSELSALELVDLNREDIEEVHINDTSSNLMSRLENGTESCDVSQNKKG